jgi:hypothetical protein
LEPVVILASVIVNRFERTGTHEPKSISVSVTVKLPLHPGIFIVAVAPLPLAVTPEPVKLRVVTVVDWVLHSSWTVIVPPPPPPVPAIVSCRVAPVPDGVIVMFAPATSSASVSAREANAKSVIAVEAIDIATFTALVMSPFALTTN